MNMRKAFWVLPMTLRKFGPKSLDDPTVGGECPACQKPFKEGDYTTLVSLGPGDDEEARQKCREGRYYTAVAVEVHYACATGITDVGAKNGG